MHPGVLACISQGKKLNYTKNYSSIDDDEGVSVYIIDKVLKINTLNSKLMLNLVLVL